jgi:dTDP-glucose 4,6-dehydratase
VIPTIITQALAGADVKLGSLRPTRDLNYVTDTVDGFVNVANCPDAVGQVTNIGTGREISIGDLAQLILQLLGSPSRIVSDEQRVRPEMSEVERLLCNANKAHALTGWKPRVALEDGLRRTIDWIRAHQERYKPQLYNV